MVKGHDVGVKKMPYELFRTSYSTILPNIRNIVKLTIHFYAYIRAGH